MQYLTEILDRGEVIRDYGVRQETVKITKGSGMKLNYLLIYLFLISFSVTLPKLIENCNLMKCSASNNFKYKKEHCVHLFKKWLVHLVIDTL